ncbi:G-type lectin S-receptor-like serine/threonine-protein kinase [Cocos nucifera]|uniref:Receptor-like serine/threonine-protein kinase n=1 Tax=Cocos nucifera TaxID=13894 RepID=A0A8K0HZ44_COCNU|nr:G-type lectin S-receptor-like serine/threonine-protein kinase [Cocos nucifera]
MLSVLLLLLSFHPPAKAQQLMITSFSAANSTWFPSNNSILVSPKRTFAAGFINSSSDSYFFAVWVQKSSDKTVVWSLNRTRPVSNSSGLAISPSGVLSLNDSSGSNLWTNATGGSQLVLQESGALRFGDWSSFDSPTDTVLTNQPLRQQKITLSSGDYQFANATSLVFNGSDIYWGSTDAIRNLSSDGKLLMDNAQSDIVADVGLSVLRRLTLDNDGNLRVYSLRRSGQWDVVWQAIQELCNIHGACGVNAICEPLGSKNKTCSCPPGYEKVSKNWDCQRKIRSLAQSKFLRLDYVSFRDQPGTGDLQSTPLNFETCKSTCLGNATCVAFSYKYTGKQDCVILHNQLIDGYWSPATELATFLRVSSSETDNSTFTAMITMIETVCPVRVSLPVPPKASKTTARNVAIIATLFTLELLAAILSFWAFLRKYSKYRDMARTFGLELMPAGGPKRFSYAELKAATNDFSNVIGSGGYGVVYKGQLPDRRVIAVKRLRNVGGGEAEFWAEVTIIARMHHLNLVRMWGFCAEKEQRMLVYEYIPNGSLDKFLFPNEEVLVDDTTDDSKKRLITPRPLLDWNIRYRIALGVARAIAYLHEECLEWVLHCDIKPENILLEDDFCPKVSDFGLSKLTNKKDKVTMSRIRGTRGYLAPEWVIHREPITAKADVYSFGMVLLEIVTGVRNSGFRRSSLQSEDWYFPKWAFEKVYMEQKVEDILDSRIADSYDDRMHFELVERMVKTAIWCLQDRAEMRPSMGKVAKMLEGTVEITEPVKPTIFCVLEE